MYPYYYIHVCTLLRLMYTTVLFFCWWYIDSSCKKYPICCNKTCNSFVLSILRKNIQVNCQQDSAWSIWIIMLLNVPNQHLACCSNMHLLLPKWLVCFSSKLVFLSLFKEKLLSKLICSQMKIYHEDKLLILEATITETMALCERVSNTGEWEGEETECDLYIAGVLTTKKKNHKFLTFHRFLPHSVCSVHSYHCPPWSGRHHQRAWQWEWQWE